MPKIFNRAIEIGGEKKVIGTPSITILEYDTTSKVLRAKGASVPTDADAGYAKGCVFIKTDGGVDTTIYLNEGSNTSCNFNAIVNSASTVPAIKTYQETFAFGDMTDSTGVTGTFDLSLSIPKGAIVMQSFVDAVTGFAGDTSATIQIGDGTDPDRYSTGTPDVFTTADHISAGAVSGTAYHSAAKTVKVTITAATDWGDVTAGAVTITIFYYQSV